MFDAAGMIVAPGFIDMHVHLREPGFEHAETIETGVARGGGGRIHLHLLHAQHQAGERQRDGDQLHRGARARARRVVNVFPIGAITKGSAGEELAAIGSMKEAGTVAISDDGRPVMNARVMRRAMEFARVATTCRSSTTAKI